MIGTFSPLVMTGNLRDWHFRLPSNDWQSARLALPSVPQAASH